MESSSEVTCDGVRTGTYGSHNRRPGQMQVANHRRRRSEYGGVGGASELDSAPYSWTGLLVAREHNDG